MSSGNPYQSPTTSNVSAPGAFQGDQSLSTLLFGFQGRIPRRIFWAITLGTQILFYLLLFIVGTIFEQGSIIGGVMILATYIPMFWICLAAQIKRWHDRDKPGWWVLISLVPLIGA